jgi:hypothetical protein
MPAAVLVRKVTVQRASRSPRCPDVAHMRRLGTRQRMGATDSTTPGAEHACAIVSVPADARAPVVDATHP